MNVMFKSIFSLRADSTVLEAATFSVFSGFSESRVDSDETLMIAPVVAGDIVVEDAEFVVVDFEDVVAVVVFS